MQRYPVESNFYVSVSGTEVEVTFAPTQECLHVRSHDIGEQRDFD